MTNIVNTSKCPECGVSWKPHTFKETFRTDYFKGDLILNYKAECPECDFSIEVQKRIEA